MLKTHTNTIWFFRSLIGLVALSYFLQPTIMYAYSDTEVPAWIATNELADAPIEAIPEEKEVKPLEVVPEVVQGESYDRTFIISAYYSPVPGQKKYVTGSFNGDIRLNGGGVHGADGTPVYPGMIAAPKTYAFGTKMDIPGIGIVAVHDRGGAIVNSGARGNAHDRLDVWMGYGDEGLTRALQWGKRTVQAKVYGINESIKENINLGEITVSGSPSNAVKHIFSNQLTVGSTGEDVKKLQDILTKSGYYNGDIDGVFDSDTRKAVSLMQVDKGVVANVNAYGSGYVGPQTMRVLASLPVKVEAAHAKTEEIETQETFVSDLQIGDSGEEVRALQLELKNFNLLGIEPTGFYGEVTEHAVFKFQQIHKLAGDKTSLGAGVFGPITRNQMNEIVRARLKIELLIGEKDEIDA